VVSSPRTDPLCFPSSACSRRYTINELERVSRGAGIRVRVPNLKGSPDSTSHWSSYAPAAAPGRPPIPPPPSFQLRQHPGVLQCAARSLSG
jgi:hypothetical protein